MRCKSGTPANAASPRRKGRDARGTPRRRTSGSRRAVRARACRGTGRTSARGGLDETGTPPPEESADDRCASLVGPRNGLLTRSRPPSGRLSTSERSSLTTVPRRSTGGQRRLPRPRFAIEEIRLAAAHEARGVHERAAAARRRTRRPRSGRSFRAPGARARSSPGEHDLSTALARYRTSRRDGGPTYRMRDPSQAIQTGLNSGAAGGSMK